jgi:hypothetical protein
MQGGLTPHAEPSPVDRVERVPLHLDDPAFPVLGQDTASGRTLPAGRGIPSRLANDHVIRGMNQRIEGFFRFGSAADCKGNTSHAGNFEEGSAVHTKQELPEQNIWIGSVRKNSLAQKCLKIFPLNREGKRFTDHDGMSIVFAWLIFFVNLARRFFIELFI